GPQYVCTTFWTFVCTNCSGVHREFTHRVKSVSMAKFNEDEIISLQAGGNERAREIYFKAWDPHRNTYPDGSNLNRLRDFVKHVYIDRKYAGENKQLSMAKLDSCRRYEKYEFPSHGSSLEHSSPFKRNGGITFRDLLEERSPPSSKSRQFEIVDDRFRDEGSVRRYDRHSPGKEPSRSPLPQEAGSLNFEILREKKIKEPPKNTDKKDIDDEVSMISQNTTGATISSELADTHKKQNETLDPSSLIEFEDKVEPDNNPPGIDAPKATTPSKTNNDSTFSATPMAPNNHNSLESLLFNSVEPVSSPSTAMSQVSSAHLNNASAKKVEILQNDHPMDDSRENHQVPSLQEDETSFNPRGDLSANASQGSNRPPRLKYVNTIQNISPSKALAQGDGSQATSRKEIQEGLFTSSFASLPPPNVGWQMHQTYGMGYDMQFCSPAISTTDIYNASRPKNPFDTGDKRFQSQIAMFPSMSPLQEGFSNMAASTGLISQSSHCAKPMSPHVLSHLGPGAYMVQLPNNMPQPRPQAIDLILTKSEDAFASPDPIYLTSGTNSSPTIPSSTFSRTGNPFG
ncbi:ArfGap/RecO-like zinc finger domain-containing protein, partial [Striga hermonthica]